jgi:hypothetical protein
MAVPQSRPPSALHDRAAEDLRFIRDTIERASAFTAISGLGYVVVGLGAVATAAIAGRLVAPQDRLGAWLVDAALSVLAGSATTALKSRRARQPVWSGPLRKFASSLAPALVAGAALTAVLAARGAYGDLPALWLLCYGAGLAAAGAFSVRLVPLMGWSFIALGLVAVAVGPAGGEAAMLLGFGGLHLGYGIVIARRYGG